MSEMYDEECCNCGIIFCMTMDKHRRLYANKKTFYCPSGHPQHYTGESDASKIKRLRKVITDNRERHQQRVERLHAQIQRLKIARGRWRGIAIRLREVSDE